MAPPGMPGMQPFPGQPLPGQPPGMAPQMAPPPGMPPMPDMAPPPQGAHPGMPPQMPPHMLQQMIEGMQAQMAAAGASGPAHGPGGQMAMPQMPGFPGPPTMAPPPGIPPGMTGPQMGAPQDTLAALLGPQGGPMPGHPPGGPEQHQAGMMQRGMHMQQQGAGADRHGRPGELDGHGGMPPRGRRGETREQIEAREKMMEAEKVKCHLHKKPKNNCKFCKKYQDLVEEAQRKGPQSQSNRGGDRRKRRPDRAISEDRDNPERAGPLEIANPKTYGFSGLLQTHIVECAHFKSLLTLETFEQLVEETYQFANSVEPYMANSGTLPSALFCCLYRFFTMGLDGRNLKRLIENQDSPYIRCCGFLYARLGLPHDQVLGWLGEYLIDDEEFKPSPDSDYKTTIGEYVETLLSQDKYYNTVLPRLPMVTKRHVEERLAPLSQNRKRMQANKSIVDVFRDPGVRIECCIAGEWRTGSIVELEDEAPNRPKVRARLDDGSEEYVHLGLVIVADRNVRLRSRSRRRGGGRSRSRSKTNWSIEKGRSDKDLVEEMRSREREKAVCSSGKDYARKPVGYKAACALPREQGAASYRLMEEETFVPMNRTKSRRSPTPEREQNFGGRRPSAEHQARMQQLFEKYGNQRSNEQGAGSGRHDDVLDRPDVMRLG